MSPCLLERVRIVSWNDRICGEDLPQPLLSNPVILCLQLIAWVCCVASADYFACKEGHFHWPFFPINMRVPS
ncbi:hypothetical protein BDV10DRAFT_157182 [Aspergillus recurvatus]